MEIKQYSFESLAPEELSEKISRRYVYGEKAMLVRFELKKGAIIPRHNHPNEQITYIIKGAVRVHMQNKDYFVRQGEVIIIPSNVYHEFEALEDTIDIDVFSPPREDWIQGTDSYLRKK
jgi:quercetin dioxygenase-like cupin family protein